MTKESCIYWLPVSALIDKLECAVHLSEAFALFNGFGDQMLQISLLLLVVDVNFSDDLL